MAIFPTLSSLSQPSPPKE